MLTECGPGGFELQACAQLAHRTRLNRQLEQGPVRTWFEIVQASTTDEQWSAGMTDRSHQAQETVEPAASFEPYLQLEGGRWLDGLLSLMASVSHPRGPLLIRS